MRKFKIGIGITAVIAVISVIGIQQIFGNQKMQVLSEEESKIISLENVSDNELQKADLVVKEYRDDVVSHVENNEKKLGSQEEIIKMKMMNARYNYDTASGKYTSVTKDINSEGKVLDSENVMETEFKVDYANSQGLAISTYRQSVEEPIKYTEIMDGAVNLNHQGNVVMKTLSNEYVEAIAMNEKSAAQKNAEIETSINKEREFLLPQGFICNATEALEPQQLAMWLNTENNWEITGVDSQFNRSVLLIKGIFGEDWKRDGYRDSFEIIVDKETGIVFEAKIFDDKGNVISFDKMEEIEIIENNRNGKNSVVSQSDLMKAIENMEYSKIEDYTKEIVSEKLTNRV